MPKYNIHFTVDAARLDSVQKKARDVFGEDISFRVGKLKTPETRADRLAEAEAMADDARGIVEELKDEMEQWYDSIPENLQNGSKAEEVQEAQNQLEELQSTLEQLDFSSVSFPGMF